MTTTTKTTNLSARANSIAKLTGGKPEWYRTHAICVQAERCKNVIWDGAAQSHKTRAPGALVKSARGSWSRTVYGRPFVAALTSAECQREGLRAGPANV